MKRLLKTLAIIISLSMVITLMSQTVFAEGTDENKSGDNGKAVRTVMLYLCGSNLESISALGIYNIRQILSANYSEDEDVNFIIMTGGSGDWHAEKDWLIFPEGVNVPEDAIQGYDDRGYPVTLDPTSQISNMYNQIWEVKGADAPVNAGTMKLLDGDGITGEEGEAIPSYDELMRDPKVMKAFINYGVEHYPAEKYDLILWDHGGGPTGGFGADDHDAEGRLMSFSELTDALSDNAVTNNDADGDGKLDKFDFIDFDACLMSSIELQYVLADYADYYISSPETEPGYGQYYTNWLDMIGEDPDADAFQVGKKIVDDFITFYEAGPGVGQDGTLTVTDTKKFLDSGIVDALSDMNRVMKSEAGQALFYDELKSVKGAIQYGDDDFFDLGNLASLLSVRTSEVSEEELEGDDDISNSNEYNENDLAARVSAVLDDMDDDIIYKQGTEGIRSYDQYIRYSDGTCGLDDLKTSGVYIFFPAPKYLSYAINYYDEMTKVIESMPDKADGRYEFLRDYLDTVIDYALIGLTGRTVNSMINTEDMDKRSIDYAAVKDYWQEGQITPSDLEYTQWGEIAEPLLSRRTGGEQSAVEWLDKVIRQQAEEALDVDNVSGKEVKTKTGNGYKIHIDDVRNRSLTGVRRKVTAELPVLEDYMNEHFDPEGRAAIGSSAIISLGSVDGTQDYLSELDIDSSPSDIIRWMNKKESSWDISPAEEKWYAISDAEDKLHVAAIYEEDEDTYAVVGLNVTDKESKEPHPVVLIFSKNEDDETRESILSEIVFISKRSQSRRIRPQDLTAPVVIRPVIYVNYWGIREYYLPISEHDFEISAEEAGKIKMVYTDVSKISDIRDTDGDRSVLHSNFTVSDIYDNIIDISDQVNKAEEKLIDIDMVRIRTGIYNGGQPVPPEVIYRGETLEEGEDKDYTWSCYDADTGQDIHELTECGEYNLELKGYGKFTGYTSKEFRIVLTEDAVEAMIDEAQRTLEDALSAVAEAKESGNEDALISAYEQLVEAQKAVAAAQTEYSRMKEAMDKEKQEELEEQIAMLEDQVEDLTDDLNEAMVIDISNFAVTMDTVVEFDFKGNEVKVSVAGLAPEDYSVIYDDNYEIGTAKVTIRPKGRKYKGEIVRTYKIVPRKVYPEITLSKTSYTYDGKAKTPSVSVIDKENVYNIYMKDDDYTVSYQKGRKNAGTYKVTVKMMGYFAGTFTRTFKIRKAVNPLKVRGKSAGVKLGKLRRKDQTLKAAKVIRFTKKVSDRKTYKLSSAKKGKKSFRRYFKLNKKTGKVTVKKGLKKGTYKVSVKIRAAGNANYKASSWKKATFKVKVK